MCAFSKHCARRKRQGVLVLYFEVLTHQGRIYANKQVFAIQFWSQEKFSNQRFLNPSSTLSFTFVPLALTKAREGLELSWKDCFFLRFLLTADIGLSGAIERVLIATCITLFLWLMHSALGKEVRWKPKNLHSYKNGCHS